MIPTKKCVWFFQKLENDSSLQQKAPICLKKKPSQNVFHEFPEKFKYHFSKQYVGNLTYQILLDLIDSNLKLTYFLFHNFTLFVHNLAYSETNSQELVELMLLKTKGNA